MVRGMKHTEIGEIPAEWELQTFEETFRMLSNNTLPRADLNNRGGTVRNVHYGDILTRFGEVLDCEKDEVPYLNDGALLTASAQVLQDGDVILADTAEDDTVGKTTEVYGLGKGRMVAGLHTIPCRVKKGDFVPKWLGYYMNSPLYHDQVLPYVTGIKVSSISRTAISETLIVVPPIEEQKVIVSALSEVDQLLVELKKVVSKLRDFKRGCLYLMFPQDGSDVPQMREAGYSEPWEQCKLSLICDFEKGKGLSKDDIVEEGVYPCILYGQLFTEYGMFIDVVQSRSNTIGSDYKLSKKGDILIPRCDTTPDGLGRASSLDLDNVILGSDINILKIRDKQKYDSKFISATLNHHKKALLSKVVGSTVRHLENKELKDISIEVPCSIKEQQMIGSLFQQLENVITLHQQKFDKYAQIKKAMMSELITGKIKLV